VQTDEGVFSSDSGITIPFLRDLMIGVWQTGIHCSRAVSVMRKPRSALIFFVLLVLSLTLAVPAEDVLETTYDESETQPYEAIPHFSILSLTAGCTSQAHLSGVRLHFGAPSRLARTGFAGKDSRRSAKARVAQALLCTLRC